MLNITQENCYLGCHANNKKEALRLIADAFMKPNNVNSDCFYALSKRENQISTYITNGVAIPHLSKEDRNLAMKDEIKIFQFPDGVMWDGSHIVFIAIAVFSKNDDDHIDILKSINPIIRNDVAIDILAVTKELNDFLKIISRVLKTEN